jgi:hypothetical protein
MIISERRLSPEEIRDFAYFGCVLIENGVFSPEETERLGTLADEVASIPPSEEGRATHHYERNPTCPNNTIRLCRVESFIPQHKEFTEIVENRLVPLVSQLFGERAMLFKEKLNFKHANGGGGYAPHYDGPSAASTGLANRFITAQLAIDDQTVENGCLQVVMPRNACPDEPEMVPGHKDGDPDRDGRVGAIPQDIAASMPWQALPCKKGDVLLFHGFFPHRSPSNKSSVQRRTAYFLFNAESDGGDCHEAYILYMKELRKRYAMSRQSSTTSSTTADSAATTASDNTASTIVASSITV